MRTPKIIMVSLFLLMAPVLLLAQDEPKKDDTKVEQPVDAVPVDTNPSEKPEEIKAEEVVVEVELTKEMTEAELNAALKKALDLDEDVDAGDMVKAAGEMAKLSSQYFKKGDETTSALAWTGMVAGLLKLLLMLLKLTGPFWKQSKGKWVLRFICLGVGVGFGVISYIGLGYSWYNAVITVFGGPGAILITELQKMVPFLRAKKEA